MTIIKFIRVPTIQAVQGLDYQLAEVTNILSRKILSPIDEIPGVTVLTEAVPWLQSPAVECLKVAIKNAAIAGLTANLEIKSAYRTIASQLALEVFSFYLLQEHNSSGKDSESPNHLVRKNQPTLVDNPFTNGDLIEINDPDNWRDILLVSGWRETVDPCQFRCHTVDIKDIDCLKVFSFQRLWNIAHPEDLIPETKLLDDVTRAKLELSPGEGFPNTPIPRTLKLTSPIMSGDDVKTLQAGLNKCIASQLKEDGIYGVKTTVNVELFQQSQKLPVTGFADIKTVQALRKCLTSSVPN